MMAQISSQERDFFINDANPTPIAFFKRFNCTLKKIAVSRWYSVLSAILKVYSDNPKLVNIYKNYKDNGYKQAIEDYFKSTPASVLDNEKVCQKIFVLYRIRALHVLRFFHILPEMY
jgi:hypothetical protein